MTVKLSDTMVTGGGSNTSICSGCPVTAFHCSKGQPWSPIC